MNARYPARPTGMFGQVNRSHVVAAIAATIGLMVGAAGAAAWDAADDSGGDRAVFTPEPVNIDRIAYNAALDDGGATLTGRSGAESISSFGNGFVDVEDVIVQREVAIGGAGVADDRGGRGQVFSD